MPWGGGDLLSGEGPEGFVMRRRGVAAGCSQGVAGRGEWLRESGWMGEGLGLEPRSGGLWIDQHVFLVWFRGGGMDILYIFDGVWMLCNGLVS